MPFSALLNARYPIITNNSSSRSIQSVLQALIGFRTQVHVCQWGGLTLDGSMLSTTGVVINATQIACPVPDDAGMYVDDIKVAQLTIQIRYEEKDELENITFRFTPSPAFHPGVGIPIDYFSGTSLLLKLVDCTDRPGGDGCLACHTWHHTDDASNICGWCGDPDGGDEGACMTSVHCTSPFFDTTPCHADITACYPRPNLLDGNLCPIPLITSIYPEKGPLAGNTWVTISGSNLASALVYSFYERVGQASQNAQLLIYWGNVSTPATDACYIPDSDFFNFEEDIVNGPSGLGIPLFITTALADATRDITTISSIICLTPPGLALGKVDLCTEQGTSIPCEYTTRFVVQFEYTERPRLATMHPRRGPLGGGTRVVFTGTTLDAAELYISINGYMCIKTFAESNATHYVCRTTISDQVNSHSVITALVGYQDLDIGNLTHPFPTFYYYPDPAIICIDTMNFTITVRPHHHETAPVAEIPTVNLVIRGTSFGSATRDEQIQVYVTDY